MSPALLANRTLRDPRPAAPARRGRVRRLRLRLADGATTTLHVALHDPARVEVRVAVLPEQRKLVEWCAERGVEDALVGGFFARPDGRPLGEVRTGGVLRRHVPFLAPWDAVRACVHVEGGRTRIAPRGELPATPRGDLLQAGPLLVAGGRPVFDRDVDVEGFRRGAAQFDSDITAERHPRAALGVAEGRIVALVADGRGRHDAGLTLAELADVMAGLGSEEALNLDGGGSASLVAGGELRNRPRAAFGVPEIGGRPVSTALLFVPRT
jgi:hypothetical protein